MQTVKTGTLQKTEACVFHVSLGIDVGLLFVADRDEDLASRGRIARRPSVFSSGAFLSLRMNHLMTMKTATMESA